MAPSLPDLKKHLNITTDTDDAEMIDVLDAATEVVAGLVGDLTLTAVTETHNGSSGVIALRRLPVADVVSVSSRGGSLTSADYELDSAAGLLYLAVGTWWPVTVTYHAGFAAMPAAVRLAILIVAAHLWETQRMPGQSADARPAGFGGGADGEPDSVMQFSGFAIPNRAQELLQRYIQSVRVA